MVSGRNKKRNILVLSYPDPSKTAGIVGMDLYLSLNSSVENQVQLITGQPSSVELNDPNVTALNSGLQHKITEFLAKLRRRVGRMARLKDKLARTDRRYVVQEYDVTRKNDATHQIMRQIRHAPDLIIVLFMPNFLTFKNLYELQKQFGSKIYLYLMDMAPMTGGCHYAWDCRGYTHSCGKCPAYHSKVESDQSRLNWEFKHRYLAKLDVEIIAPSVWVVKQAKESSLFGKLPIHNVQIPIDPDLFKPRDKHSLRPKYGLKPEHRIVFFGANSISERRKGFAELVEALSVLRSRLSDAFAEPVHLAIAGHTTDIFELPFPHTMLGHLSHTELAEVFSCSDMFVCPSLEDSGPMMVNQSIISGTPVVAFRTGVALDLIKDAQTGFLATIGNSNEMAEGIHKLLVMSEEQRHQISVNCRETGLRMVSTDNFCERVSAVLS